RPTWTPPATFQSTRPRGARLVADNTPAMTAGVSIHAPAWGATLMRTHCQQVRTCFNPRARVGRDNAMRTARFIRAAVSIHTPAWGATHDGQPAPPGIVKFQSTRPRGARLRVVQRRGRFRGGFNPRARVGRDA